MNQAGSVDADDQPQRRPQRTLQRAIRLSDFATISSDDLLGMGLDAYQQIRVDATRARNRQQFAFACEHCGFAVYAPREPRTKLPFWRHHPGAPRNCPWWTGDPRSTDDVSADQFRGAQESQLHADLKNLVAELLRSDPLTDVGSVAVERYIFFENNRRRPDVQATHDQRPIAVEIQLATTQIPIIVGREDFYHLEGRHLVWLTWNFEPVELNRMLTSILDVYLSHNQNLFSLDQEVVALGRERRTLLLHAFWNHGSGWRSKNMQPVRA